jgi:hypothetical protein
LSTSTQSSSPNLKEEIIQTPRPASASALLRHFADLRDGTHGGARSRPDKERLFAAAVPLLDPHARQALEELNTYLLLGTGEVTATGARRSTDGGIDAVWRCHGQSSKPPASNRSFFAPTSAPDSPTRICRVTPSAIGHSTSSTRSRGRQSYPPCVPWRRRRCTT